MMSLLLALALQVGPATFTDWSVACDNVKRCEMTALDSDGPAMLLVRREAGPEGAFVVEASGTTGQVSISVNDQPLALPLAQVHTDGDIATVTGDGARRIAAALAAGHALAVVAGDGKRSVLSARGADASLAYIDREQRRVATPLPVVAAIRPGGTAASIPAALAASMFDQTGCGAEYDDDAMPPIATHALGGGITLALVPCGSGAYNSNVAGMLVKDGRATPIALDMAIGYGGKRAEDSSLKNPQWDPASGRLATSDAGSSGSGCGWSNVHVFDGARFRLIEARVLDECRAAGRQLTVYRAKPIAR